jgi:hypothetical protein
VGGSNCLEGSNPSLSAPGNAVQGTASLLRRLCCHTEERKISLRRSASWQSQPRDAEGLRALGYEARQHAECVRCVFGLHLPPKAVVAPGAAGRGRLSAQWTLKTAPGGVGGIALGVLVAIDEHEGGHGASMLERRPAYISVGH